jgi:hypothetical protein
MGRGGINPLVRLFIEFAGEEIAEDIINAGLEEALNTMQFMVGNEGQQSIFESIFTPEFENNADEALNNEDYEWQDVECDPYCDFMGEIVEAGNSILQSACLYARIVETISDEISGFDDEGFDADEADFEE